MRLLKHQLNTHNIFLLGAIRFPLSVSFICYVSSCIDLDIINSSTGKKQFKVVGTHLGSWFRMYIHRTSGEVVAILDVVCYIQESRSRKSSG